MLTVLTNAFRSICNHDWRPLGGTIDLTATTTATNGGAKWTNTGAVSPIWQRATICRESNGQPWRVICATISLLQRKLIPLIDPDSREIEPLDVVACKLTVRIRAGGDLGEDPVAFGYYAMTHHNWVQTEARIVPLPDGSWISLKEAIADPVLKVIGATEQGRAFVRLREEMSNLQAAFKADDPIEFMNSAVEIRRALDDLAKANLSVQKAT